MKKITTIYEDGEHKWYIVARDPEKPNYLIDTNEYLITSSEGALLTDPGGMEVFPAVFSAISTAYDPNRITALFASHQDPDIISSLALWLEFNPKLKCYLSWLWGTFIPHFGGNAETFNLLADEGGPIKLGSLELQAIPAHYLHSAGNFHLYDPKARILFSGDVGAAMLPHDEDSLYVEDFDRHIRHAEKFHRRWMGSNTAKQIWCDRVRNMEIDMLCPQHGAIYRGEDVTRFIDWFEGLEVGIHIR
jgi:flavorubredoxin